MKVSKNIFQPIYLDSFFYDFITSKNTSFKEENFRLFFGDIIANTLKYIDTQYLYIHKIKKIENNKIINKYRMNVYFYLVVIFDKNLKKRLKTPIKKKIYKWFQKILIEDWDFIFSEGRFLNIIEKNKNFKLYYKNNNKFNNEALNDAKLRDQNKTITSCINQFIKKTKI